MRLRPSNRFSQFDLSDEELNQARQVSPYFWAYLQNKIADYASAIVEFSYDPEKDQRVLWLELETRKAQVQVLEELMNELIPPPDATVSN